MSASVTRTHVSQFDAIVMQNAHVRAVILPSLGGRVWELVDRRRDRQWIWHRHDVPLAESLAGASYDDVWAGGWEELFPNDAAGDFEGRLLPDHGEWWTAAWDVVEAEGGDEAVVRLATETRVRRARCTKEFRLASDSNTLSVSYRVENLESQGFHCLFKQHLPIALTPACQLALPGGRVTSVSPEFGTLLPGPGPFEWPVADVGYERCDLRHVPAPSPDAREFVYVDDLPAGWCGVDDVARGAALRMNFDQRELPFVWLFLAYGGWRGCYTAVLEPCTNMPKDLGEAVRGGRSLYLGVGGSFQTRVAVSLRGIHDE